MTAKQFYSEDGQKLQSLQSQHDQMLNRQGYYSKGVAKLSNRIAKLTEKMNIAATESKMTARHTKGDWQITNDACGKTLITSGNVEIAVIDDKRNTSPINHRLSDAEIKANAKLISCAPELLEALQEMIKAFQNSSDVPVSLNNAYFKCKNLLKRF